MTTSSEIRSSPSGPLFDVAGAQGAFGGAFTFPYAFSLGTPPPDPGLGQLKLNLGPQNTATEILISTVDANSALIDSALATIDDSTNPTKGFIRLVGETDTTKWLLFTVTAISAEVGGIRTISVTGVASSSANPFSDLDPVLFCFDTSGNKGDTGPTEGWAASLLIDAQSGATSPIIDAGQSLLFTTRGLITAGEDVAITGATGANLTATTGLLALAASAAAATLTAATTIGLTAGSGLTLETATGGATLRATSSAITIEAQGADNDVTVTAADALTLTATAGAWSATSGTTLSLSGGSTASLTGATGATITATTGTLALAASAAAATLTAATSIDVTATSGLTLQTATGNAVLRTTSSSVTVEAQGAGNDVTVTAADALTLTATAGAWSATSGTTLSLSGGSTASLTGATGATVTATTGTLTLSALAGTIAFVAALGFSFTATSGDITITASAGSVTLDGSVNATVRAGSGTALLQSTAGAAQVLGQVGASVTATTSTLTLTATAAAATLTAGTTIGVTATSGLTLQTTTGNAALSATNSLATVTGQTGTSITATTGTLALAATAAAATLTAGTTINVTATSGLTLQTATGNTVLRATSSNIDIEALGAGNDISITANDALSANAGGNIAIVSSGGSGQFRSATTMLVQSGTTLTLRSNNGTATLLAQGATNSAFVTAANGNVVIEAQGAGNDVTITAADAITAAATAGALSLSAATTATITGGTGATLTTTTGNVDITSAAAAINLSASTLVTINNFLRFTSQASSTPSLSAGQGMFWVLTATPTTPQFTDSANTDWELATLPIQPADLASQAEGTTLLRALGTGTGTPIAGSGAQLAQNIRFGTDVDDTTTGTQNAFIVSPLTDNIRFTPASALTINGIAYTGPTTPSPAGKQILLYNARTSTQNVTFAHESGSAVDASFRILCPGNVDAVLRPGDSCYIRYAFNRWILSTSPQQVVSNDTFPANVSGGTTFMSQKTFTSLVSATTSLSWDATNKRIDYTGSTSNVNSTPSGAAGVVDISTLQCGGSVTFVPGANSTVDGFTAKSEGFWFDIYYNSTSSFTVTLNDNVGATTTSIRCPQATSTFVITTLEAVRLRYLGSRWRIVARLTPNGGLAPMAANTVKANATAASAQPTDVSVGTNTVLGRQSGNIVAAQIIADQITNNIIAPSKLASIASSIAVPYVHFQTFTAGGGGAADDITIYNGDCPFNCRLLDVTLLVSTAVVGSSAQLRNLAGGGGSARSSVLSTAATGTQRNNDTQTFTFVATGSLFLRRSDSGVAGTLILTFIRT